MTAVADEHDLARAFVEKTIGRTLRPAERPIDVLKLDLALNQAKDQLERAVRKEMLRATRHWLRSGFQWRPRLTLTHEMRAPILNLHLLGRQEARLELDRVGVPARAHAAHNPNPRTGGLDSIWEAIAKSLPGVAIRIHADLVEADLSDASSAAIARALLKVPGARDIASRVVSTALMSGMGATFEEHEDLIAGWERTAVLDGNTCGPCDAGDGTQYPTWAAAQVDMPNGGPAVDCDGEGRCRCRLVPLG